MKIFPVQSLLISEFDKIKAMVEEACAGPGGQALAKMMNPVSSFEDVVKTLSQTEEFRKIISNSESLRIEAYPDLGQELKLLHIRNSVLTATQFLQIRKIVELMKTLLNFFKNAAIRYPVLAAQLSEITFENVIIEEIQKVLDESGIVRSNASPALASIRKQIARKRIEADQLYNSIISKYRKNGWITDNEESWRNGRRVISIYIEHKRSAKGIIHDISATGKTCYVEPDEAIPVNNMVFELEEDEKQEIYNILKSLTETLRKHKETILIYDNHVSHYDFIAARAHIALQMNASLPFLINKPQIDLREAKHPLLYIYNKVTGMVMMHSSAMQYVHVQQ